MSLPKPYYEESGIVIYNADCREILPLLPEKSVDLTVTSPPYNTLPLTHSPSGIHGKRKSGINVWIKRASESYEDHLPENESMAIGNTRVLPPSQSRPSLGKPQNPVS